MQFIFSPKPDGSESWVEKFLRQDVDREVAIKIVDKLKSFEQFDQQRLMLVEHIKKVDEIYELRVRVKSENFRFLGKIVGVTFFMVHVYHKKSQKLPKKEIGVTKSRINLLNL